MVATLIALPIGLVSLLPKSAFATELPLRLHVQHSAIVVAQPYGTRAHHGQEQAAAKREVIRYEESRRTAQRKRWSQALLDAMGSKQRTPVCAASGLDDKSS